MLVSGSILEHLVTSQELLEKIDARQSNWSTVETWIAGFRPFLRQYFPNHLEDFNSLARKPSWSSLPGVTGPHGDELARQARRLEGATNTNLASEAKAKLVAFLNALIGLSNVPTLKATGSLEEAPFWMPFRPYERFKSELLSISQYSDRLQTSAIDGQAEEEELQALGGRTSVLASIQRHCPEFDPVEAQSPYAPAWAKLKPVLTRAGLVVDDSTTLTDIKAYLDAVNLDGSPRSLFSVQLASEGNAMPDPRTVFIVHGRNELARKALFDLLRAIGLNPLEWGDAVRSTGKGAPYVGEILEAGFKQAQAFVVLLTGDDLAHLRPEFQHDHDPPYEKEPTPQARPNVLFEAGMAFGRHPERTIIVQIGPLRPFSDIGGRHVIQFTGTENSRTSLRDRLRTAGCQVKETGTDWLTAGNFDEVLTSASTATKRTPRNRSKPE